MFISLSLKNNSKKYLKLKRRTALSKSGTDLTMKGVKDSFEYTPDSKIYPYLVEAVTKHNVYYQWRRKYVRENKSGVCPTLTANMGTGGHNVPIVLTQENKICKLTPRQCLNLQGFPMSFTFPDIAISHQYKQIGNSVSIPVVEAIARRLPTMKTFIDLFCGIGGFRIALERLGMECVFSSDIDKYARKTYQHNFGEEPSGDITQIKSEDIPDHDLMTAGFPCQPFSIAGYRKGFEDDRGQLFYQILRIAEDKKTPYLLLENVKGLINHNKGATFSEMVKALEQLGYTVQWEVLNTKDYGLPQNRERLFIIASKEPFEMEWPLPTGTDTFEPLLEEADSDLSPIVLNHLDYHEANTIKEVNDLTIVTEVRPSRCSSRSDGITPCLTAKMGTGGNNVPILLKQRRKLTVNECLKLQGFLKVGDIVGDTEEAINKAILGEGTWKCLQKHRTKHQAKGNGFGYSLFNLDSPYTNTITSRYHKDGAEALLEWGEIPRKFTPGEIARLQGFPEDFNINQVSRTQAYKQLGNAVSPIVVEVIIEKVYCLFKMGST